MLTARASAFARVNALAKTHKVWKKQNAKRSREFVVRAVKVEIRHEGKVHVVEVGDGDSILDVALDAGIELRHDCKMGVCMMCPAKVVKGKVDQSGAMLSDDVTAKGFALLCCSKPEGEGVVIQTVSEDELLEEQLCSSG